MNLSSDLHRFIVNGSSLEFEYGPHDCAIWPANWCVMRGHDDPAARWRGKYDEAGAQALVEKHGLLDLWTLGMIDAQIPECDEPQIGDVGIVECTTADGINQCGAIYGGKRWHALSPKGVFQANMPVIRSWRVG
jgi:hypothetical protein